MTQEEKQLLLKDICARLPYGVKCFFNCKKGIVSSQITAVDLNQGIISHKPEGSTVVYCNLILSENFNLKPYLRPMSSMTDEEKEEYSAFFNYDGIEYPSEYVDWLNAHHFDYRGLFEKGLALEAPEGMYKAE